MWVSIAPCPPNTAPSTQGSGHFVVTSKLPHCSFTISNHYYTPKEQPQLIHFSATILHLPSATFADHLFTYLIRKHYIAFTFTIQYFNVASTHNHLHQSTPTCLRESTSPHAQVDELTKENLFALQTTQKLKSKKRYIREVHCPIANQFECLSPKDPIDLPAISADTTSTAQAPEVILESVASTPSVYTSEVIPECCNSKPNVPKIRTAHSKAQSTVSVLETEKFTLT